jgi:hypothetical protein
LSASLLALLGGTKPELVAEALRVDCPQVYENRERAVNLDGRWALLSKNFGGHGFVLLNGESKRLSIEIRGQRITGYWKGSLLTSSGKDGVYRLDLTVRCEEVVEERLFGVCQLEGDSLTITVSKKEVERPMAVFPTTEKSSWTQFGFRRTNQSAKEGAPSRTSSK